MNQLTLIAEHSSPVGLADAVPRLVAVAVLAAGMHQALVAVLARPSGPATGFGGTKSKSSDKSDIGTRTHPALLCCSSDKGGRPKRMMSRAHNNNSNNSRGFEKTNNRSLSTA